MTHHPRNPAVRRAARILALVPAIAVTCLTSTALADPPAQWENNDAVSPLHVLLVIVLIPVALFVGITLLVYLPSMSRGQSYQPGRVWRGEPTWFGGPRGGIDAVDAAEQPQLESPGRGGSSGHW